MYATSLATQNMRSRYPVPDFVKPYTHYLEKAGYYLTNRSLGPNGKPLNKIGKLDYNHKTVGTKYWQDGDKGSYKNRPKGMPFFHIYNTGITHESTVHASRYDVTKLVNRPADMVLPPYHPDTLEIRQDWARYYDSMTVMDDSFGNVIADLKASGDYENTIIFYYSDHGGIIGRSKRFLFDTGTKVPLLIHFPKKWQHLSPVKMGTKVDNVVTLADLAPTLMDILGLEQPEHFHGESMLKKAMKKTSDYAYLYRNRMDERIDLVRALRDKRFKYIRNFMPHRPNGQHLEYLWLAKSTESWEKTCQAGGCNQVQQRFWQTRVAEELYDTQSDPWEVNNLANNPKYKGVLTKMRADLREKTLYYQDAAFIPEGEMIERTKGSTAYDLVRHPSFPLERIVATADMATSGEIKHLDILVTRLGDEEAIVRYWAAVGMGILSEQLNQKIIGQLKVLLSDPSADVQIAASEVLVNVNQDKQALTTLVKQLGNNNAYIQLNAANVIDQLGAKAKPIITEIQRAYLRLDKQAKKVNYNTSKHNKYVLRSLKHSLNQLKS
jgi:hypothetical protein